ncbi:MAG: M67 family metallopeptidase [Terriglobales bacterium]
MLKLEEAVVGALIAHARQDAPIEACGYLAEKAGAVSRVFRLRNVDASQEHFTLDPAEQFMAVRDMRKLGYRLRAVYHSHPATPARPSQEDIRLAQDPGVSYVIVSLAGDEPDVRSFRIVNGEVAAEEIEVVASAAAFRQG